MDSLLWKLSTIWEQIFWKSTVPYDFHPKCLVQDFVCLSSCTLGNEYSVLFSWDQNLDGGGGGKGKGKGCGGTCMLNSHPSI